jgi:hypothetical protein
MIRRGETNAASIIHLFMPDGLFRLEGEPTLSSGMRMKTPALPRPES